jgi:DNA-binding MarR family transcriptional regulator
LGDGGVSNLKLDTVPKPAYQSVEEQALLNLLRTADRLERAVQHKIRPWGVTSTQYNVLRILRGAQHQGLTCSAIGERMITAEPDITRLLSRLKALKLIRQARDRNDRRVVRTEISDAGLKLLRDMDPMIERAPVELMGHLGGAGLKELIRLLEAAGKECEGGEGNPQCEGQRVTSAPKPLDPRVLRPVLAE